MRKILMLCVLLSSLCAHCDAQEKMRDVFLQMPDSLLPYLTENNKLDFLDFIDSGMNAVVTNELGGKSEMVSLTDTTLFIQLSSAMNVNMRLMPVKEDIDSCNFVICVLATCGESAPETKVNVYSVKWNPLVVSKYLELPIEPYVADFVDKPVLGLRLQQMNNLDVLANEEQKKDDPWLKSVEWKQ